jgi:hypothetical protein
MKDQQEHDELKGIAPLVSGLPKHDPFVVPEGFFDRFPHEVQAAIIARSRKTGWAALPIMARRVVVALPALALLAGLWWYLQAPAAIGPVLSTTPSLDEMSWSEEHELLASMEEEELPSLGDPDVELTEAELAAYLAQEGVDLTELIAEP